MSVTISHLGLWAYVVLLSILMGGALFEMRVLVSVWASLPPESVRNWNSQPQNALDPPRRFFAFVTPPLALVTLLNLYLAWQCVGPARLWWLFSDCAVLAVIIATFAYYAPTLHALTGRRGEGLDDQAIVRKTRLWVVLQYVRLIVVAVAWLAALRAFRMGA